VAKKSKGALKETELYRPLNEFLTAQGYTVRGEVRDCDLTATKGDELIVIELKTRFCTQLLVQATRRQRAADSVYVAIPRAGFRRCSAHGRGLQHVLRRLELGLILITPHSRFRPVEVIFHPLPYERKRHAPARRAILQELAGRSGDYNQGGSTRQKLITAYRENAIAVACGLEQRGPLPPRELRALGTGEKTLSILSANFYGWFERVERGVYALKPAGRAALERYAFLAAQYRQRFAPPAELRASS
jgi:hypothetical protein